MKGPRIDRFTVAESIGVWLGGVWGDGVVAANRLQLQ